MGEVAYDLGFGGAFYAFVNARELGLECTPDYFSSLVDKGRKIKNAIIASRKIIHPVETDLSFLYGTIFVDFPDLEKVHSRHCCIFAEGEVDRSPTGTGVSARLAILDAKNELTPGVDIMINSIINTGFTGKIARQTSFDHYHAVIPEITGSAHITGMHEFLIDPDDSLNQGFILR